MCVKEKLFEYWLWIAYNSGKDRTSGKGSKKSGDRQWAIGGNAEPSFKF